MQPLKRAIAYTLSFLLSATFATGAQAPARTQTIPVILTVEGGGSLGVYEGGLTWAIVELFRQQRRVFARTATDIKTYGRKMPMMTIGISDVNGLAYWIGRLRAN